MSLTCPGPLLCKGSAAHGFLPELSCLPRAEPAVRTAAVPGAASTEWALHKRVPVPGGPRGPSRFRSAEPRAQAPLAEPAVPPRAARGAGRAPGTSHSPVAKQSRGQLHPALTSNTESGEYGTQRAAAVSGAAQILNAVQTEGWLCTCVLIYPLG